MVDAMDKILGRLPGRLSLIAVGAGTLLAAMTGDSTANIAILARGLLPEMEKRGYQRPMTLGPILGSSQLATMIPPSALAVFLGAIGHVSIKSLLMGIIFPGLVLASLYAIYIIVRCVLQPSLAPSYTTTHTMSLLARFGVLIRYVLPAGIVIFAVIGVMLMGIATPSEAAALGAIACYVLAAIRRRLNWGVVKRSAIGSIEIIFMIFMIIAAATTFTKILSYSGAITGLVKLTSTLPVAPILIIIASQVVVAIMGCFIGPMSILLITLPIYMPIINAFGFNPVWFGVMMILNVQMGCLTPPFGMDCYVMKSLAPSDVTLGDIFLAAVPFFFLGFLTIALIMAFPQIALWLPGLTG